MFALNVGNHPVHLDLLPRVLDELTEHRSSAHDRFVAARGTGAEHRPDGASLRKGSRDHPQTFRIDAIDPWREPATRIDRLGLVDGAARSGKAMIAAGGAGWPRDPDYN